MAESLNWVDRRARQEDLLESWRPRLWDNLLLQLESAAKSYTKHFGVRDKAMAEFQAGQGAAYVAWNPNFPRESRRENGKLRVSRANDWSFIEATYSGVDARPMRLQFAITGENQTGLICEGKPLSDELVCRLLLEPLFFPLLESIP